MTTIHHQVHAACPPARVWALLADLEAVQQYNPGVRSAAVQGTLRSGVVERVALWEDGRALGLEVAESDWPIHFMRWITRIEPSGEGTRITQGLEYKVKFGPLGWLLDRLMMKRKLTATLDDVFASLVRHAEGSTSPQLRKKDFSHRNEASENG